MNMNNDLLKNIELLRKEMSDAAMTKGPTSNEAISLSQELDKLLNLYQQTNREKITNR